MTSELRETEHKYEARPGMALPPLEDLPRVAEVSGPQDETLTAEYYDTHDLRLLQAGVTLRRREGGADEGWHLKLPDDLGRTAAGAAARREIQVPFDQAERGRQTRAVQQGGDPVPGELARLVRVHSRGIPLRPVARIETRRRRTTLRGADGASLAEVVADAVAARTLGATTTVTRWDEVEVELTGGSPRLLKAANKRLRHGGLRPAAYAAKLDRAMAGSLPGHADSQAPAGRAGRKLTASSPAGDVVLAYVAAQAERLKALDPAVRREEPGAIHQMRVAARRLRTAFQAFPMVVPKAMTLHARDELRWLGQVLGEARDNEVLGEHFRAELASVPLEFSPGPVRARVTAHFAARQAAAQASIRRALDSRRYLALLDELDLLASNAPVARAAAAPAGEVLPLAVAQAYQRTARRVRRARRMRGPGRDLALHEARKAAKRARYAAEAATPALGTKARRFAKRMKAVQSALGDHHDAVTAGTAARQVSVHAHLAREDTFSYGLLAGRAHRQAQESRRRATAAWKRVTRPKATSVTPR